MLDKNIFQQLTEAEGTKFLKILEDLYDNTKSPKHEFVDGEKAQQILKCGKTTLYNYRVKAVIPYYKIGGKILYKTSELHDFIAEFKIDKI